jgi:hypothetical protein
MADEEVRTILVQLRFAVQQGDQKAAQDAINQLEGKTKVLGSTVKDAESKFRSLRMAARELSQIGLAATMIGTAIVGPLTLAANKYIQMAGAGEQTSEKWLEAQKQVESAEVRIGRVAAEQMLPALEKGAEIMGRIADFAEKHPDAVKAALGIGGALVAIGGITVTVAELLKVYADIGLVLAKVGVGSGVASPYLLPGGNPAGAAATGIGGTLAALIPAAVAATIAYIALNNIKLPGQSQAILPTAGGAYGEAGVLTAAFLGKMVGGPELAAKWGKSIGDLLGVFKEADAQTQKNAQDTGLLTDQQKGYMQAFVDNFKAEQQARKTYTDEVTKDTRDFQQSQLRELQNFTAQEAQTLQDQQNKRMQELRDYAEQEAQSEQDYYKQRMDAAATYNTDVQRMEEDHQIAMKRAQQDHASTMLDLAQQNDVLGAYQEIARYSKQRQRDEQDYQIQAKRKNQDFAKQMGDMEANFQIEEKRRSEAFAQQITDEDAQNKLEADRRKAAFAKQRQQEIDDFNQKMNDLAQQFNNEEILRRQAYNQQLTDLKAALDQEKALRDAYNAAMIQSFQQMTGTTTNNKSLTINNPQFNTQGMNATQLDQHLNNWAQQAFGTP